MTPDNWKSAEETYVQKCNFKLPRGPCNMGSGMGCYCIVHLVLQLVISELDDAYLDEYKGYIIRLHILLIMI